MPLARVGDDGLLGADVVPLQLVGEHAADRVALEIVGHLVAHGGHVVALKQFAVWLPSDGDKHCLNAIDILLNVIIKNKRIKLF